MRGKKGKEKEEKRREPLPLSIMQQREREEEGGNHPRFYTAVSLLSSFTLSIGVACNATYFEWKRRLHSRIVDVLINIRNSYYYWVTK